jgi:hypothetical protein
MKNYHLNHDQEFFFLELISKILDSQMPIEYACYQLQKSWKDNYNYPKILNSID